jgi:hypothetical protein
MHDTVGFTRIDMTFERPLPIPTLNSPEMEETQASLRIEVLYKEF